jgi:hypothetical protein
MPVRKITYRNNRNQHQESKGQRYRSAPKPVIFCKHLFKEVSGDQQAEQDIKQGG